MVMDIVLFFAWTALEIVVVAAMIRWGFENGQWTDIEEPKYRMLIDREPEPWPGREKPSKPGAEAQPDTETVPAAQP